MWEGHIDFCRDCDQTHSVIFVLPGYIQPEEWTWVPGEGCCAGRRLCVIHTAVKARWGSRNAWSHLGPRNCVQKAGRQHRDPPTDAKQKCTLMHMSDITLSDIRSKVPVLYIISLLGEIKTCGSNKNISFFIPVACILPTSHLKHTLCSYSTLTDSNTFYIKWRFTRSLEIWPFSHIASGLFAVTMVTRQFLSENTHKVSLEDKWWHWSLDCYATATNKAPVSLLTKITSEIIE